MRKMIYFLFLLVPFFTKIAYAIDCVKPPDSILENNKYEFDFALSKVWKLRGPSIAGAAQKQTRSLLEKIPNADKALVELTYIYIYCTALKDDMKTSDSEKSKRFSDFANAVRSPVASKNLPSEAPSVKKNQIINKVIPSPPSSINIQGNSAPITNGNIIGRDLNLNKER